MRLEKSMRLNKLLINWEWSLSLIVVFLICIAKLYFCFFGVEFTDEIFPIAISYSFSKGALPYLDEWNVTQNTSIFFTPITMLYCYFFQTEAIVLFYRFFYFLLTGIIFFFSYIKIKKFINNKVLFIILAHFMIGNQYILNTIGYNSITNLLFFFGTILFCRLHCAPPSNTKSKALIQISLGICHGAICIIYPSIAFFLCFLFLFYIFITKERKFFFLYYTFGFFMAIAYPIFSLWRAGLPAILDIREYISGFNLINVGSIKVLYNKFSSINKINIIFIIIFYCFYYNSRTTEKFKETLFFGLVASLTITGFIYFIILKHNFSDLSIYLGFLPIFFVPFFLKSNATIRQTFFLLWVPPFLATFMPVISSTQGANASCVLTVNTVTFSFLLIALCLLKNENLISKKFSKAFVYLGIIGFFILALSQFTQPYRDDHLSVLETRIESGPYKGLYTTAAKAEFLTKITKAVREASYNKESTILFYDRFPAGYLLTNANPYTPTIWMFQQRKYNPPLNRKLFIRYYAKKNKLPTIIVRMKKVYYSSQETDILSYTNADEFDKFVQSHYKFCLNDDNFEIYASP